jgi:YegS/Rv2252/BmrU family lipid kinase
MKRIIFFINPGSGTGDTGGVAKVIERQFQGVHFEYYIRYLEGQDAPARIGEAIEEIDPDVAVAAGGDGTINMVASAILDKKITLGILPLGSSNGLAYELGIPSDLEEAVVMIEKGKPNAMDVLSINDRHHCMHLSDLGLNARVVKRYDHEDVRGFYGYAKQYFRELGNRKKFRCEVEVDGKVHRRKAVMIVMANGSFYGTGASITPDGNPGDGFFELILIYAYPFWFIFYMFISIFTRRFNDRRFRKIIRGRNATIRVDPPQELQVDGEHIGRGDFVTVEMLPQRIEVITGE